MYSCKEIAELISQSMDHQLTLRQKIGFYLHLSMCTFCARHKKQMDFLKQLLDLNKKQPDVIHRSMTLSRTKKEEIKKCLRDHTHS